MANTRIMLTCKHCGEALCIGKGYLGSYVTMNRDIYKQLNDFYKKHSQANCIDEIDVSENARDHFVLLEEGEVLSDVLQGTEIIAEIEKSLEALRDAAAFIEDASRTLGYTIKAVDIIDVLANVVAREKERKR